MAAPSAVTRPADMLPAYRALLALLRPQLSPPLAERARTLAAPLSLAQRQWLVERAVQEGAAEWLLRRCGDGVVELPPLLLQPLQRAASAQARRTLQADALRLRLRPLLAGAAAPLTLLKGASIEQRAYPTGVIRPCTDVDVLTSVELLPEVDAQLRRWGYVCARRDPSGRTHQYHGPPGDAALDLHLRLACPRRFPRYGAAAVAQQALQRGELLADGTRVLAPADASLHLLVHLAAGLGGDLRHLADADQWLRALPEPSVAQLLATAAPLGAARAVRAALGWLAQLPHGAVDRASLALAAVSAADLALAGLQRRWALGHYLRHGPVLPPALLALTELLCVDFPRGAVGLARLAAERRGRPDQAKDTAMTNSGL